MGQPRSLVGGHLIGAPTGLLFAHPVGTIVYHRVWPRRTYPAVWL